MSATFRVTSVKRSGALFEDLDEPVSLLASLGSKQLMIGDSQEDSEESQPKRRPSLRVDASDRTDDPGRGQ